MTSTSTDTSISRPIVKDEPASLPSPSLHDKAPTLSTPCEHVSAPTSPPYSSFTKRQKWLIIFLSTFAASFSPLSSFIFFPAITTLSDSLNVSTAKINYTITSYMIVAGIAPALMGDLADTVGRRAAYLLILSIYCLANIGLALQSNWAALFVLRMMQSAGSACEYMFWLMLFGIMAEVITSNSYHRYWIWRCVGYCGTS